MGEPSAGSATSGKFEVGSWKQDGRIYLMDTILESRPDAAAAQPFPGMRTIPGKPPLLIKDWRDGVGRLSDTPFSREADQKAALLRQTEITA
jgi:hypothetical protein